MIHFFADQTTSNMTGNSSTSQKISTLKNLAKEAADKQENPCLQQSPKKAVPSINKQSGVSHTIVNDNFPSL